MSSLHGNREQEGVINAQNQDLMSHLVELKLENMPIDQEDEEDDSYTEMDEPFKLHIKEERSRSLVEFPTNVQTLEEDVPTINFNFIVHGMPYGSSTFIQQHFGIHSWQRALASEGQDSIDSLQEPVICSHLEGKTRKISACSQTSIDSELSEVWNLSLSCECCKKIYKYLEFPEDFINNNNVDELDSSYGKYLSNGNIYAPTKRANLPKIILNGLQEIKVPSSKENIREDILKKRVDTSDVPLSTRKADIDEALQWLRQQMLDMKQQDRVLMRQLLELRSTIHQLRGPSSIFSSGPNLSSWSSRDSDSLSVAAGTPFNTLNRADTWSSLENRTVSMLTVTPSLFNDLRHAS